MRIIDKKIDYFESINTNNLKNKAIKGAGINLITQVICFTIRTGGTIILARLLIPSDFGLVAMVAVIYLLLANFGFNGFTEYIIQKKEITHKEVSTIFWLHAFISLILTISFILFAPLIAWFYKEPLLKPIAMVMSICILALMLSTYHLALLKRIMHFKGIAFNLIATQSLSVGIAVFLAYKGYGYWAVVARQTLVIVFQMIFSWIFCRWLPGLPGNFKSIIGSLKYTINVYGSFIMNYFEKNIDKVILGKFFGSNILGNYDRAYYLSYMPVNQIIPPLNSIGLSTLSKLKSEPERYQKYYQKAILTIALFGFFMGLTLLIIGDDIIYFLLGKGWELAGLIITVFAPGLGMMIIYATNSWLHLSLSQPNRMLYWNIGVFILRVIVVSISALYGPIAVAASISILYYLILIPSIWYAGRPIKLKIYPVVIGLLKYFVSAILSYLLYLFLFKYFYYTSEFIKSLNWILKMFIDFLFITISYICFIIIIHRNFNPFIEMLDFIKIFFKRK